MILPQTVLQCLLLMILGTLCLGSWAATYRSARKLRFELYYVDYALGVGATALTYAFTAGNMGYDGFGVLDDLMHAGKRQWLFAFAGGVTFNLANMLIVGAISIAGMAVALMLGAGLGILAGIGISQFLRATTDHITIGGSLVLSLAAILVMVFAYVILLADRRKAAAAEQTGKKPRRQPGPIKGILVALIGGLLMAASFPLYGGSEGGEFGLGPYTAGVLFAAGIVSSTLVFSMFFMNLPLQGEPVEMIEYVRNGLKSHLLGLLGGFVWCTGFLAMFVALGAPSELQPNRFAVLAFFQGAPLLAAIWGVGVFREFRTSPRGSLYALLAILLLASSLSLGLLSGHGS